MKKILSIILVLAVCFAFFAGCKAETATNETNESGEVQENKATQENEETAEVADAKVSESKVIKPLPETLDISNLDNCTVAVSLGKGDAYVNDSGKMVMKVKVYSYELYDMVDIASLEKNDVIVRRNEEVKVTKLDRLDSGLVRINGGEENDGFDLISDDSTVYYEIGMSDSKAYYELGEATIPVSTEFEYVDESDLDAKAKAYYPGDFLTDDAGIEYRFTPDNTSIVIENGEIIKMNKVYMP